jgi:sugar (pentulose or hexulose) kinase
MLAGLGVGIYPDAESAVASACRPDMAIQPDPANHDRYSAAYESYRAAVASATLHTAVGSAQRDAGSNG